MTDSQKNVLSHLHSHNYFIAEMGDPAWQHLIALEELGMVRRGRKIDERTRYWHITEVGTNAVERNGKLECFEQVR